MYPEGVWYTYVDKSDIDEIVDSHLVNGKIVERTDTTSNMLIVDLPEENAAKISAIPGVKAFHKSRVFKEKLDQANLAVSVEPNLLTATGQGRLFGAPAQIASLIALGAVLATVVVEEGRAGPRRRVQGEPGPVPSE